MDVYLFTVYKQRKGNKISSYTKLCKRAIVPNTCIRSRRHFKLNCTDVVIETLKIKAFMLIVCYSIL